MHTIETVTYTLCRTRGITSNCERKQRVEYNYVNLIQNITYYRTRYHRILDHRFEDNKFILFVPEIQFNGAFKFKETRARARFTMYEYGVFAEKKILFLLSLFIPFPFLFSSKTQKTRPECTFMRKERARLCK